MQAKKKKKFNVQRARKKIEDCYAKLYYRLRNTWDSGNACHYLLALRTLALGALCELEKRSKSTEK